MKLIKFAVFILLIIAATKLSAQTNKKCELSWTRMFNAYLDYYDTVAYFHGYYSFFPIESDSCVIDSLGFIDFLVENYVLINDTFINLSSIAHNTSYKPAYYGDTVTRRPNISSTYIPPKGGTSITYISRSILAMYYINSLLEGTFKFRNRIQLNYKGEKIGVQSSDRWTYGMSETPNNLYEVDNIRALNRAVRKFHKWNKQLQKRGLNELREKKHSPFTNTHFSWG